MVLAFVEHDAGTVGDATLEALAFARDVAEQEDARLAAVAFGDDATDVAGRVGEYGVEVLYAVEHADLETYAPQAWAETVSQLVEAHSAGAVVHPGIERGHEVLAHVAAKRDLAMAANCVAVEVGDEYEVTRLRWGGTLLEHARLSGETKLLTAAENEVGAEPAPEPVDPTIEPFEPSLAEEDLLVAITRIEESDVEGIPLGEARVVVGGGRGVGSPEGFDKLEELAELLDAAIGSSRAAVNEGWRSHDDQIGQTGAKISPHLYIPCGISGAVQHMVGCKGAEHIMAINTDPEAAIIGHADYAVIADLHEVVPELNDALRDRG